MKPLPALLLFVLLWGLPAQAIEFIHSDAWSAETNAVLQAEYWIVSDSVTFPGRISNDFYFATGKADLSGDFGKDLSGLAQSIDFDGRCAEDVRLMTYTLLRIRGQIGNTLMARSSTVEVGTNAVVGGDAYIIGETVSVHGDLHGDLTIEARQATLSGRVAGHVFLRSPDLAIMPGTEIMGNLTYTSSDTLVLNDNVILHGELIHEHTLLADYGMTQLKRDLTLRLGLYGAALFVGIPLLAFFPMFTGRCIPLVHRHRGRSFITGLVGLMFLISAGLFTIYTVVGIPFALICLAGSLIIMYMGHLIAAMAIGTYIIQKPQSYTLWQMITALSLGLLILYALTMLPLIGAAVWITATLIGAGAILIHMIQSQRNWSVPAGAAQGPSGTDSDNQSNDTHTSQE